jgi:hypothetical protein
MHCDISRGDIAVTDNAVACENGPPVSLHSPVVSINGSSARYGIAVSRSRVTLAFAGAEIRRAWPLVCTRSDVTVVTAGGRTVLSAERQSPGISCVDSNISFFTADAGASLEAANAALVGIGAAPNATCGRLLFLNGTWRADEAGSGAGIGAASGDRGTSRLRELAIYDGRFFAQGGAGIGAGAPTERGDSIVDSVVVWGGRFVLEASFGAALGSGRAEIGRSEVKSLVIHNGTFSCTAAWGSAVGSAFANEGVSTIGRLVIEGGSIVAMGSGGIGSYPENQPTSKSFVGELAIANGSVSVTCMFEREHADHPCIAGDVLMIGNATVRGSTESVFVGRAPSARWNSPVDVAVVYRAHSADEALHGSFLHFGFIVALDNSLEYVLHIENRAIAYAIFDGPGLLLSVSKPGRYEVTFTIPHSTVNGSLCYGPNETTVFTVGAVETFIEEVHFCPLGYVRRSRTISLARSRSPAMTPTAKPAATADVLDTGSLVAISVGLVAFLFAVFGVVILARWKKHCDRQSEIGISILPGDKFFTENLGEQFAGTDESAA